MRPDATEDATEADHNIARANGTFAGITSGGKGTDPGAFSGSFHGASVNDATTDADESLNAPSNAIGTFDGHFCWNGHVLGAFGTTLVPD